MDDESTAPDDVRGAMGRVAHDAADPGPLPIAIEADLAGPMARARGVMAAPTMAVPEMRRREVGAPAPVFPPGVMAVPVTVPIVVFVPMGVSVPMAYLGWGRPVDYHPEGIVDMVTPMGVAVETPGLAGPSGGQGDAGDTKSKRRSKEKPVHGVPPS